jgi:CheY-like chemotaxis protein
MEYIHKIPGLLLPNFPNTAAIDAAVNKFIDAIPAITQSMNKNYTEKHVGGLIKDVEKVLPLLEKTYARSLESAGKTIISSLRGRRIIPRGIKSFITNLHTLSIDMQTAQGKTIGISEAMAVNETEKHADIVSHLTMVLELFDDCEYEDAEAALAEISGCSNNVQYAEIILLIKMKQHRDAIAAVKSMLEKEKEAMENSVSIDLSKKILAVDDRPEILPFVSEALKNHYKVYGATSSKDAVKILESQTIDLFILDIEMPEMDGYELAQIIRKTPHYADTPIIFLTNNTSREHVKKALASGGSYMIAKPSSYETILSKVSSYLETPLTK